MTFLDFRKNMIQVKNLHKNFGQVKAVDGLSFSAREGDIIGLLGPNGAGKTTTMRLLSGFLFPDQGEILIGDLPLEENLNLCQEQIGYLAENNPLYQDMLVSEILKLSMDLKHIRADKRKEALDFAVSSVGIENVYYHPIKELSKGYKQRVGMAIALIRRPGILILDEPTEGLDPNQRQEIRNLIKRLAEKRTILMSTHVMAEASAVCNRILIINQGKLAAEGTPEELSSASDLEQIFSFDLEGEGVETLLKSIIGKSKLEMEKRGAKRFAGKIMAREKMDLQPALSRLAAENHWIIWRINEEEHKLEEIFQKLTGNKDAI